MDRDRENLWTRRSNNSKLSLSVNNSDHHDSKNDPSPRDFPSSKRFTDKSSAQGRANPFNNINPVSTNTISSPTSGASTAFGLGSGAFASFGSASKTPKTPGTAFDFGKATGAAASPSTPSEKRDRVSSRNSVSGHRGIPSTGLEKPSSSNDPAPSRDTSWPLKYTWVVWYRPPTSKNSDYEKSTKAMCKMATAQEFWRVYAHLKRPSALPTVSDYHFFKEGIRPVWEDEENKKGGKWIMRLKKGVADRYWEDLLMAMVGDQFAEAGEEVCGAVVSVRSGEDVFSIWTKNDGGRNVKIRETIKRVLALPPDTNIVWKSHDDSITQRSAIDEARQQKGSHHASDKRRVTLTEEPTPIKEKSPAT
ncbi:hypothetical protein B0A49_06163 [Cryomyces minteri]|uniref:Eukaryotic translation initiation factor 4E type 2 n=1 Tax=Cryomyces minteri TaxID=331657 RepID=A0A4U0WYF8_9PEZI|nr:hypothetical protein B0A49_06163 [Cryomyces minteri]